MIQFQEPKIVVAVHKPSLVPNNDLYTTICAGASKNRGDFVADHYDDQGVNISSKNNYYCELTPLYWFWKNCKAPVIGLCHYRRYFKLDNKSDYYLTKKQIKNLPEFDILLPTVRKYWFITVKEHFEAQFSKYYWSVLDDVILDISPDYYDSFNVVSNKTNLHLYNMFIMKWDIFDEYMNWLFYILEEIENRLLIAENPKKHLRMLGHYAERLLNVWIEKNSHKYNLNHIEVINTEKHNEIKKTFKLLLNYSKLKLRLRR